MVQTILDYQTKSSKPIISIGSTSRRVIFISKKKFYAFFYQKKTIASLSMIRQTMLRNSRKLSIWRLKNKRC